MCKQPFLDIKTMEICWGVETEKQKLYSETINFYSAKFSIQQLKVIGLFIGGRGIIPTVVSRFLERTKVK